MSEGTERKGRDMITEIKESTRTRQMGGGWVKGKTDEGCTFEALVFEEPSEYGIQTPQFPKGGNISKLHVQDENRHDIAAYDRGWDGGYPEDEHEETVNEIIIELEAMFCK